MCFVSYRSKYNYVHQLYTNRLYDTLNKTAGNQWSFIIVSGNEDVIQLKKVSCFKYPKFLNGLMRKTFVLTVYNNSRTLKA